jgi:hypothetical protein
MTKIKLQLVVVILIVFPFIFLALFFLGLLFMRLFFLFCIPFLLIYIVIFIIYYKDIRKSAYEDTQKKLSNLSFCTLHCELTKTDIEKKLTEKFFKRNDNGLFYQIEINDDCNEYVYSRNCVICEDVTILNSLLMKRLLTYFSHHSQQFNFVYILMDDFDDINRKLIIEYITSTILDILNQKYMKIFSPIILDKTNKKLYYLNRVHFCGYDRITKFALKTIGIKTK